MPFYHFTDYRNISSIKRFGLLSWSQLESKGIVHFPSSNKLSRELDEKRNLQDFIRLTKTKKHPMAYQAMREGRVKNLVWLEVEFGVVNWSGTLFSDINATASGASVNKYKSTFFESEDPQAEILVRRSIGVKWISFPNEVSKKSVLSQASDTFKNGKSSIQKKDLYSSLVELRLKISKSKGIPAYCIFNNDTLQEMVQMMPKTKSDLLSIRGVGEKKVADYGREFLNVIRQHI